MIKSEIWNISGTYLTPIDLSMPDTPWLTASITAAAELSQHCSITSCKSTCWSLFNSQFSQNLVSEVHLLQQRQDTASEAGPSHKTSQVWRPVSVPVRLSALSAAKEHLHQPMPHLSILSLAVPALRFSTALGVEVVSPETSSESGEHLLFTRSKPKSGTLWEAKSFTVPTILCVV